MLEELPPPEQAAQELLGELYDHFPQKVQRLQLLLALDADFGGRGAMLPGGFSSYLAYIEARSAWVSGNFLSVLLLAQSMLENLLGAHIKLNETVRPIHGLPPLESGDLCSRPSLRDILGKCVEAGVIGSDDSRDIQRLADLRNPLTHFRDINDPQNIDRRAMETGSHPMELLESDARFAISLIVRLVANAEFAIGRFPEGRR